MNLHHTALSVFSICLLVSSVQAQTINAFAGNHTGGYSGDNGAATAAACYAPAGVAVDNVGNVYFADLGNSAIRKVSPSGVITTFAGNGTQGYSGDGEVATAAQINQPTSIATDAAGNVYFTDDNNNCIRRVDASGIITTVAGTGVAGYSGDGFTATTAMLNAPSGIAVDRYNNIYIADVNNQVIRKVDVTGIITTIVGEVGLPGYLGDGSYAAIAKLHFPKGLAVDSNSNLFIADQGNSMVRKYYAATGIIGRYAGDSTANGDPIFGYGGDGGLCLNALLNGPTEVAISSTGTLYIADYNNARVRKVTSTGTITTIAGNGISGYSGDGGLAINAEIGGPYGVAVAPDGRVFITDEVNNVVRVVDAATAVEDVTAPSLLTVYPNPSSGTFSIDLPAGIHDGTITIAGITGAVINTRTIANSTNSKINFDLVNIPAGTYIISLSANEKTYRQKIAVW